ncbi:MAG: hypothetical protein JWQ08_1669 [Deinococcus sp.]|nr:hypothetical protein [Deinococcus sp.]
MRSNTSTVTRDHRYDDVLDVAYTTLSDAGLPVNGISAIARGGAVLKHAQGATSVQASVRTLGAHLHLERSTDATPWVRMQSSVHAAMQFVRHG